MLRRIKCPITRCSALKDTMGNINGPRLASDSVPIKALVSLISSGQKRFRRFGRGGLKVFDDFGGDDLGRLSRLITIPLFPRILLTHQLRDALGASHRAGD